MSELEKAIIRLSKVIEDAIEKFNDFYTSLPKYMRTEIMFPKKEAERNNEEDEKGEKGEAMSEACKECQEFDCFGCENKDKTTEWLGSYSPYQCKHCGKHTDSKTPFCAWCGRRATNYD